MVKMGATALSVARSPTTPSRPVRDRKRPLPPARMFQVALNDLARFRKGVRQALVLIRYASTISSIVNLKVGFFQALRDQREAPPPGKERTSAAGSRFRRTSGASISTPGAKASDVLSLAAFYLSTTFGAGSCQSGGRL